MVSLIVGIIRSTMLQDSGELDHATGLRRARRTEYLPHPNHGKKLINLTRAERQTIVQHQFQRDAFQAK